MAEDNPTTGQELMALHFAEQHALRVARLAAAKEARIAELEADNAQLRKALTRIRDEAATMKAGGAWAAGLASLFLGTLKAKDSRSCL